MYRPCLHCDGKKYDEEYCPQICTYGELKAENLNLSVRAEVLQRDCDNLTRTLEEATEEIEALQAENAKLTEQLKNSVVLPFLIDVSDKYAVVVYKDKFGELHKTHTFERHEALAMLAELGAQNDRD